MKNIILVLFLVIFIVFLTQPRSCHQINYHLSSSELKKYTKMAEENNESALMQLYAYYRMLYKDENSAFMVECKGVSINHDSLTSLLKSRTQGKWKNENNISCPKEPLKHLKDHSSWIPIQIQIIWLCGKR